MSLLPLFNQKAFEQLLASELTTGLAAVAEPILKQALVTMEDAMRKELARMVVGLIQSTYDLSRDGRLLHIRVQLGKSESP